MAVALVFGQCYRFELLEWDDMVHVVRNANVNPPSWTGVIETWRKPYFNLYVPATYTFFAVEAWLAELNAVGNAPPPARNTLDPRIFHLGNLCLHMANVLLVYVLLKRLVGHRGGAFFGALLFALHPMQVECVAWVSETRGLLAGLFSLLAAICYLRVVGDGKPALGKTWQAKAVWYATATVLFALALLSKPSAVSLPLMLLVLQSLWVRQPEPRIPRQWLTAILWLIPWLALAAVLTLVNKAQQSGEVIRFVPSPAQRLLIAGDALSFYLAKLVFPWPLAAAYGHSARQVLADPLVWLKALAPLVIAVPLLFFRPRRVWLTGAGVFLAALAPILGLVPFGYQDISTVADRYLYLALIGPALVVAYFVANNWSRAAIGVAASLVLLFAGLSAVQASYWIDEERLFAHCLWVSPTSYVAHDKVGLTYLARREAAIAADHFLQARDIDPTYAVTYNNLGNAYRELQRFDQAVTQFRLALNLEPTNFLVWFNLGNVYLKDLDDLSAARDCFERVIRIKPEFAAAHLNLGVVLLRQGDATASLAPLEEALRLVPGDAESQFTLGHALWQLGRRQEALAYLEEAFRKNPAEPRYLTAWQKYQRAAAQLPSSAPGP